MLNRILAATTIVCLTLGADAGVAQDVTSHRSFVQDGRSIEVDIIGRVEFTDDSGAIESQAPGSRFTMSEAGPNIPTRRIELTASETGTVERRYLVNGNAGTFDADARDWFERTLREVIRATSSSSATATATTSTSTSRTDTSRGPGASSSSSSSATAEPPF